MSVTFGVLKTSVASALRDPDSRTFTDSDLGELVNAALSEVSRIAPDYFQENIVLTEDTLEYVLRSDEFGGVPNPDIEVMKVEVWDYTEVPARRKFYVEPAANGYVNDTQTGWLNWGGTLYIPRGTWLLLDGNEANYILRIWGYSPYADLTDEEDVANISEELKWAVVAYCRVEALQRLVAERDLFTQWQTRAGNSDISPAGLMNALSMAQEDWRRRSRAILRLRTTA
jgi:hypothetical protein